MFRDELEIDTAEFDNLLNQNSDIEYLVHKSAVASKKENGRQGMNRKETDVSE